MQAENVTLKTDDGVAIKGWFIPAPQATDKTVLILHGHGDNKSSFLSQLATPRDQIEGTAPKGEHYLLETDNHLVVPINKKVRILTTASDVIHS